MTLAELQYAMTIEDVQANLDSFAVGILVNEQSKNRKALLRAQSFVKDELTRLDESSQDYQDKMDLLRVFENQPELGFYYTVALFDNLAETYPIEAKQMLEAVLSFDTMGRYLLEERPIVLDRQPFVLETVMQRRGIHLTALKDTARQNQLNTEILRDQTAPVIRLVEPPLPFSCPDNVSELEETRRLAFIRLNNLANAVCSRETLYRAIEQIPFDFSLISQPSTKDNIKAFLYILAEIFVHAKIQDCSKLETLNVAVSADSKISTHSTVAFLQNTLCHWFILSLVQAPTISVFEQRIGFIMAVFAQANKTSPHLPANASADIYLPLFILSAMVTKSVLQYHPAVKPNLVCMEDMNARFDATAITRYTNHIKLPVEKKAKSGIVKTSSLPPMRMYMTTQLAWGAAVAESADKEYLIEAATSAAKQSIARGEAVYNYFNPERQRLRTPVSEMSMAARALFNAQTAVHILFENNTDIYTISDLMNTAFATHRSDDDIDKQLQMLAGALLSPIPRIYYQTKHSHQWVGIEGIDAIDYIQKYVVKARVENYKANLTEYTAAVSSWCTAILTKIEQRKLLAQKPTIHTPSPSAVQMDEAAKYLRDFSLFKQEESKPPTSIDKSAGSATSFTAGRRYSYV